MAPIHIGIPVYDYQAIDVVGPIDLLHSANSGFLKVSQMFGPISDDVISRAPDFVFHHIGITKEPFRLFTSAITITPTTTVDECPELDIILLGGPSPADCNLHPKYADLVRRHVSAGKLLFTTCTGSAVLASTGLLDGKNATINHSGYKWAKASYPAVNWTKEAKWVVDGNIWTGAGAVAGMDMVACWLKEQFGQEILTYAARNLDYEPRGIDGVSTVIPKRYDESGKQISTHEFFYN
ncbi:DJ-1 domain InhA-type [Penicillium cf. griseofulvum]|uniref:DJ-1 domain InhA-type n=1 Tax=Penicillium cf. griseofulvum TaxID=2972120 RepID=A0A9W9MTT8_9EURO|nr:DJ-1 domain InhA-type [Penicillium cf. griseofulvum]KAJ5445899.1 DJ-1 domain InhA-type [Penicillium cf. griseofulvum]KAJ5447623.1 DJ-1 domain InhA-type [Penicillium cf. griseofulvum]